MGVASRVPKFGGLAGKVIESVRPGLALAWGSIFIRKDISLAAQ
jgi:hypothetical protein